MGTGLLGISLPRGDTLRPAEIRELWEFRRSIMRLKPDLDLDADFAEFSACCRDCERVLVVRHRDGRVAGMIMNASRRFVVEGERVLLMLPEYLMVDPQARGSPRVALGYLGFICSVTRLTDWGRRCYVAGVAYPVSFILGVRDAGGRFWIDGEGGIPRLERAVLERVVVERAHGRVDARTRVVTMPTLPPPLHPRLGEHPLYRRYVALNPNWHEGYALTVVVRIGLRGASRSIGRMLLRRLRRRVSRGDGETRP